MNKQLTQLTEWYSDAPVDSRPSEEQWGSILERPSDAPITLINFFKLRKLADNGDAGATGQDAFNAYAEVSIPTMERVGGKFLFVGAYGGMFLGAEEDWDVIAIGSYPNLQALIELYSDAAYRKAFKHRTAACKRQKVIVGNAMG